MSYHIAHFMKVLAIDINPINGDATLTTSHSKLTVDKAFVDKYKPTVNGYHIQHVDGDQSYVHPQTSNH